MFFSHVLDNIGFSYMKRKLMRLNSVLVNMRFRIQGYVAAPCEGLVICEEIDLHEYNFSPESQSFTLFTILDRICEEFIT
jgi:hypothetical protein